MNSFVKLAVLLIAFNGASAATDAVICYYESWSSDTYPPENVDVNICNVINYAFLGINNDGSLRGDGGDDILKRLVALKSRNPNLKVLVSVGGWSEGSTGFSAVAGNAGAKANLAQSALWWINTYNLDGIDIDWEYPGQRGGAASDKENFIDLLWILRNAFNDNGGYLLTIAVSSSPDRNSYNVNALSSVVDYINVMTYDFHDAGDGSTGQNSPLYASSKDTDWARDNLNADSSINNWLNAGASPAKLVLGLAFYGHSFILSDPNNHGIGAPTTGQGIDDGYVGYNKICTLNDGWTEVFDDEQKVPYKYSGNQWIGYDNPQSIGLKVQYAKSRNLGGVMMWAADNDDSEGNCGPVNGLLDAIRQNL